MPDGEHFRQGALASLPMGTGGTTVAVIAASGAVGLAIGSFLNVVAYRLPRGMSVVRPASRCPECGATLGAAENVPLLSWLALRGRCRHCQAPIPVHYPLAEAVTAGTFAGLAAALGHWAPLPSLAVVAACAVAAVLIDSQRAAVAPALTLVADVGALSLVAVALVDGQPGRIGWALLGAVLASVAAVLGDLPWARRPARTAPSARGSLGGPVTPVDAVLLAGRWAVLGSLGWSAGFLWPPGGALVAIWVLMAALGHRLRGADALRWPIPLGVLAAGALAAVLAGAVVGWR